MSSSSSHLWVIGEALIDLVLGQDLSIAACVGGSAVNLSRTAARLGAVVSYEGSVSSDYFGGEIRRTLLADGVNVERLQTCDLPTTLAIAEPGPLGSPRYRFHTEGTSAPNLAATSARSWSRGDFLVVGGLGLVLEPLVTVTLDALSEASRLGVVAVMDVNCRPAAIADLGRYRSHLHQALTQVAVVKVSFEDLGDLVGLGVLTGSDTASAVLELVGFGPTLVLITNGEGPTQILSSLPTGSGKSRRLLRIDVPVNVVPDDAFVDSIGAGDAFLGAVVAWWVMNGFESDLGDSTQQAHLVRVIQAAHAVAALVCQRRGADPPWAEDLGELFTA